MDRFAQQFLDRSRPGVFVIFIQDSLQVSELMRQTELECFGRGLQLGTETIAAPDFGHRLAHKILDHLGVASWLNREIDSGPAAKDPLPPSAPLDSRTGFIALDLGTLADSGFNFFCSWDRSPTGTFQDAAAAAFADRYSTQVAQGLYNALVTEMLLLFEINDGCFQLRSEVAISLSADR